MGPGLLVPLRFVDARVLPNKGAQCHIGQAGVQAEQIAGFFELIVQGRQPGQRIGLGLVHGLGVMALKRPARNQKLVAGLAALAVFGYMVGAAITKSALSWLA